MWYTSLCRVSSHIWSLRYSTTMKDATSRNAPSKKATGKRKKTAPAKKASATRKAGTVAEKRSESVVKGAAKSKAHAAATKRSRPAEKPHKADKRNALRSEENTPDTLEDRPSIAEVEPNRSMANIAWGQLRDAYGSAEEVGSLLEQIALGEDVWAELIQRVLHQGTLYEATIPVAAWLVHALQARKIGVRLIPVGRRFGRDEVINERVLAFSLLSEMAGSARSASRDPATYSASSGRTPKEYASIATGVLDALRVGIPLFQAGIADDLSEVRLASAAILKAAATDRP
jgi:hypothetical protein